MLEDRWDAAKADEDGGGGDEKYEIDSMEQLFAPNFRSIIEVSSWLMEERKQMYILLWLFVVWLRGVNRYIVPKQ